MDAWRSDVGRAPHLPAPQLPLPSNPPPPSSPPTSHPSLQEQTRTHHAIAAFGEAAVFPAFECAAVPLPLLLVLMSTPSSATRSAPASASFASPAAGSCRTLSTSCSSSRSPTTLPRDSKFFFSCVWFNGLGPKARSISASVKLGWTRLLFGFRPGEWLRGRRILVGLDENKDWYQR